MDHRELERLLNPRYELLTEIGRGGYNQVSLWREVATSRRVAVVAPSAVGCETPADWEDRVNRFKKAHAFQEKATTSPTCRRIASVIELVGGTGLDGAPVRIKGQMLPRPVMVMPYYPHGDLWKVCHRLGMRGRESPAGVHAAWLLVEILEALLEIERLEAVHRDGHPRNYLVGEHDGQIVLKAIDFESVRVGEVLSSRPPQGELPIWSPLTVDPGRYGDRKVPTDVWRQAAVAIGAACCRLCLNAGRANLDPRIGSRPRFETESFNTFYGRDADGVGFGNLLDRLQDERRLERREGPDASEALAAVKTWIGAANAALIPLKLDPPDSLVPRTPGHTDDVDTKPPAVVADDLTTKPPSAAVAIRPRTVAVATPPTAMPPTATATPDPLMTLPPACVAYERMATPPAAVVAPPADRPRPEPSAPPAPRRAGTTGVALPIILVLTGLTTMGIAGIGVPAFLYARWKADETAQNVLRACSGDNRWGIRCERTTPARYTGTDGAVAKAWLDDLVSRADKADGPVWGSHRTRLAFGSAAYQLCQREPGGSSCNEAREALIDSMNAGDLSAEETRLAVKTLTRWYETRVLGGQDPTVGDDAEWRTAVDAWLGSSASSAIDDTLPVELRLEHAWAVRASGRQRAYVGDGAAALRDFRSSTRESLLVDPTANADGEALRKANASSAGALLCVAHPRGDVLAATSDAAKLAWLGCGYLELAEGQPSQLAAGERRLADARNALAKGGGAQRGICPLPSSVDADALQTLINAAEAARLNRGRAPVCTPVTLSAALR